MNCNCWNVARDGHQPDCRRKAKPLTLTEAVDRLEKIMHPQGRCVECGGGMPYWRHDPLRPGSHAFVGVTE